MVPQRYTVKIVFRGLCLSHKNLEEAKLEFFLPNASSEPSLKLDNPVNEARAQVLGATRPFREHHAVLEFPQADWENRSSVVPRLLAVTKPTKEPVALYLLKNESIHFRGLYGDLTELERPENLKADEERYTRLSSKLLLLSSDEEYGFDQLPGYLCEVADDAKDNCSAHTALSVGEALTERRSRLGGADRTWSEVPAPGTSGPVAPPAPIRPLNLDIVVRFTLPVWNSLQVTCKPITGGEPGDERTFILRPSDPSREVTVWVKNRELDAILLDSDALPDPYPPLCPHRGDLDSDHALLVQLARRPELLTIPKLMNGDAADCGSGCGCSDSKP
jgi:hypothetical protein